MTNTDPDFDPFKAAEEEKHDPVAMLARLPSLKKVNREHASKKHNFEDSSEEETVIDRSAELSEMLEQIAAMKLNI